MRRALCIAALAALGLAASCKEVIGIQEASLDPTLANPAGMGSAPQASGSTGSTTAAGMTAGGSGSAGGATSGLAGADNALDATGGEPVGGVGGAATDPPTLCEQYCDVVERNCSGSLAIYTSREMCLAVCALMPPGLPGDGEVKVDSVQCRLAAAQSAGVSEPEYSCPIAALGGNGSCGTNCENLCRLRSQVCSEWLTTSDAECLTTCAKLSDLGGYTTDPNAQPPTTRGGHVQCRLYHLSAAATAKPEAHCLHADGTSPCVQ